jgi:hypothetical protein
VEDSLRAIGQTFAALGAPDPRLDQHGHIDFRIQRQLRAYSRANPPPNRVKPIPDQILRHVAALAADPSATPDIKAIADMISLAFFFLLRPGEYTGTASDTTPFTLQDVQCWIGQQRYLATDIPLADLSCITFVALTFTTQKMAFAEKSSDWADPETQRSVPFCLSHAASITFARIAPQ